MLNDYADKSWLLKNQNYSNPKHTVSAMQDWSNKSGLLKGSSNLSSEPLNSGINMSFGVSENIHRTGVTQQEVWNRGLKGNHSPSPNTFQAGPKVTEMLNSLKPQAETMGSRFSSALSGLGKYANNSLLKHSVVGAGIGIGISTLGAIGGQVLGNDKISSNGMVASAFKGGAAGVLFGGSLALAGSNLTKAVSTERNWLHSGLARKGMIGATSLASMGIMSSIIKTSLTNSVSQNGRLK